MWGNCNRNTWNIQGNGGRQASFKMEGRRLLGSCHDKQECKSNSLEYMGIEFGPFGSKLETMSGSKSLPITEQKG